MTIPAMAKGLISGPTTARSTSSGERLGGCTVTGTGCRTSGPDSNRGSTAGCSPETSSPSRSIVVVMRSTTPPPAPDVLTRENLVRHRLLISRNLLTELDKLHRHDVADAADHDGSTGYRGQNSQISRHSQSP